MNMAVGMTMMHLHRDDVSLAIYRYGDPALPVVLLVHGYPDSAHTWSDVAKQLARDYHVVTFDVRGAGQSSRPEATGAYRIETLADDLAAVIDAAAPGRPVHLVAHDWGSIQAWEAVCRSDLQARIASFTSISGPCLDHAGHWLRARLRRLALGEVMGQLLRSWYVFFFHLPLLPALLWRAGLARWWPRLMRQVEGARDDGATTRAEDGLAGMRLYRANFLRRLWSPQARTTQVPVQLLVPAREHYVSTCLHDDLLLHAPRLWRRSIGGGHWPQLTHPAATAECISEFIQSIADGEESGVLRRNRVQSAGRPAPLAGRLALVTGAGSGIGREVLLDFATQGAVVVAADINAEAAERTAMLARLLGAEAHAFAVDVGNAAAMEAFAWAVEARLGAPDILVNNAGIGMAGNFLDTSADDWQRLLGVNLDGVIHGCRLFGRQMVAAGKPGHLINLASAAAFSPNRMMSAYATSKAAVFMLGDCLRPEFKAHGIAVTTVCPGFVDTAISTSIRFVGVSAEEQSRKRRASQQLYRVRNLRPEAVAAAITGAVARPRAIVLVGTEAWLMRLVNGHAPWLARLLARIDPTP